MSERRDEAKPRFLVKAFRMPSPATLQTRIPTINNAFVGAIIPLIQPTPEEIAEAIAILGTSVDDLRCAYCGNPATEWDYLRPLVVKGRPTGYVSEIANLVPACNSKCNSSKGNKPWRTWMLGKAAHSPATRGIPDLHERVADELKARVRASREA